MMMKDEISYELLKQIQDVLAEAAGKLNGLLPKNREALMCTLKVNCCDSAVDGELEEFSVLLEGKFPETQLPKSSQHHEEVCIYDKNGTAGSRRIEDIGAGDGVGTKSLCSGCCPDLTYAVKRVFSPTVCGCVYIQP